MKRLLIIFILSCVTCTVNCKAEITEQTQSVASAEQTDVLAADCCTESTAYSDELLNSSGLQAVHTPLKSLHTPLKPLSSHVENTWYDIFLIVAIAFTSILAIVMIYIDIRSEESTKRHIIRLMLICVLFCIALLFIAYQNREREKEIEVIINNCL